MKRESYRIHLQFIIDMKNQDGVCGHVRITKIYNFGIYYPIFMEREVYNSTK